MPSNALPLQRAATRPGYSLLELVAASALVAATLVPALELVRDGIDLSGETINRQLLATYAVSELELRLAQVAADWALGSFSGSMASDGRPSLRYETSCSDSVIDGGIADQLMVITTTTYFDENGDGSLDTNELHCTFSTKLARLMNYEALSP